MAQDKHLFSKDKLENLTLSIPFCFLLWKTFFAAPEPAFSSPQKGQGFRWNG
jgi:hypothetical protein